MLVCASIGNRARRRRSVPYGKNQTNSPGLTSDIARVLSRATPHSFAFLLQTRHHSCHRSRTRLHTLARASALELSCSGVLWSRHPAHHSIGVLSTPLGDRPYPEPSQLQTSHTVLTSMSVCTQSCRMRGVRESEAQENTLLLTGILAYGTLRTFLPSSAPATPKRDTPTDRGPHETKPFLSSTFFGPSVRLLDACC